MHEAGATIAGAGGVTQAPLSVERLTVVVTRDAVTDEILDQHTRPAIDKTEHRLAQVAAPVATPPSESQTAVKRAKRELFGQTTAQVRSMFVSELRTPHNWPWQTLQGAATWLLCNWAPKRGLSGAYSSPETLARALKVAWEKLPKKAKRG